MERTGIVFLALFLISETSCSYTPLFKDALDLTYSTNEGMSVSHPHNLPYKRTWEFRGDYADTGFYVHYSNFEQGEHVGTHMDAPSHFAKNVWNLEEIPFERLSGPAVKIDISEKAARDPDSTVDVEDLLAWEEEHGTIPGQ